MTSGQLMMDQGQDVGESARIRTMILFTRSTPLTMYDRTPSTSCRFSAPVACTSGSVIIGKSIRLSIGRPLRVWQGHLVFGLTCSQVGCVGMSMPNRRRHVSAVSTACWFSDFMT
jgi:hypothetical protein